MKRLLTAAIALTLLGGSAAMAQPYNADRYDGPDSRYDRQDDRYERGDDRYDRYDRDDRRDDRYDRRDDRRDYRSDRYDRREHRWSRGERLPGHYRGRGYYVDHRAHHLRAPPRGYQWVRADNDYVMIALATGLIASIVAGR